MSALFWKVCGICRAADAKAAAAAGADAIGFVFWPRSPRFVTVAQAAAIGATPGPAVLRVGVFVDPTADEVADAVGGARLDIVQLSGDESPAFCTAVDAPVWKALRLAPGSSAGEARRRADGYAEATLLLDAAVPGAYGGTGAMTDWQRAAEMAAARRVVLAGGLHPDNVVEAIRTVRPWGVDVSSGVETEPGRKSRAKIEAFARALAPYRVGELRGSARPSATESGSMTAESESMKGSSERRPEGP